eukprot:6039792-Alexandrium_andersonii.AAC.1
MCRRQSCGRALQRSLSARPANAYGRPGQVRSVWALGHAAPPIAGCPAVAAYGLRVRPGLVQQPGLRPHGD